MVTPGSERVKECLESGCSHRDTYLVYTGLNRRCWKTWLTRRIRLSRKLSRYSSCVSRVGRLLYVCRVPCRLLCITRVGGVRCYPSLCFPTKTFIISTSWSWYGCFSTFETLVDVRCFPFSIFTVMCCLWRKTKLTFTCTWLSKGASNQRNCRLL